MKAIKEYTKPNSDFARNYLAVREKEGFLVTDELLKELPLIGESHPQSYPWKLRKVNSDKFCDYIRQNDSLGFILELGCGNGWFTNKIAESTKAAVLGMDINMPELEQANRVFRKENIEFAYGDIFETKFPNKFDLIVMNAAVQYFPDFEKLMNKLKDCLNAKGEIHIVDSFFYKNSKEIERAKKSTEEYYSNIDEIGMKDYYFHHRIKDLNDFEVMSDKLKWLRFLSKNRSPFGWFRFRLGEQKGN